MPEELRQLLLDGEHQEALKQIRGFQEEEEDPDGFWHFLEARTLQRAGREGAAREAFLAFEGQFAESPWLPKVRFHHAELLARQGAWEEAERIWAEEVTRLRGPERQRALANIYLDLAAELTAPLTGAAQHAPDDYQRARILYLKALDLDLPDDLQEQILERIAWCSEQQNDWPAAVVDYRRYLDRFDDPQVRFAFAEAQRQADQDAGARRSYEDLARALEDGTFTMEDDAREGLHGMALFSIGYTFDQGRRGRLAAISAFGRFLEAHPVHAKTSRARYGMAYHRHRLGQFEEAIEAFEAFLASAPPATDDQDELENDARLRRSAQMRIADGFAELGRFEEAGGAYGKYVQLHPDGPEWSAAQTGMLKTEYWHALQLGKDKQWQAAREAHLAFLMRHPLDERVALSLFELGDLYRQEAQTYVGSGEENVAKREVLYRQAIAEWQGVIQRFPESDQASHALFSTGMLQEMQLDELENAVASYRSCDFGYYRSSASQRLMEMLEESLHIHTDRTWRSDEAAQFRLRVRNVPKVKVELYRLDLEAYFRKHLTHEGIDRLDLDLIAADQEFEREIEDYEKYRPFDFKVDLPVEGPGVWAVVVTSKTYRATTLVLRSDLDMIARSSREEALVFVQDMRLLEGAEGVKLLLAVPSARAGEDADLVEITTDAQGIARYAFTEKGMDPLHELSVFAVDGRGVASTDLSLAHLNRSGTLEPTGFVYTERSAYLPGSMVSWRAILRDVKDQAFTFKPGSLYRVSVTDGRGRVVHRAQQPLSEFGSLQGQWRLPKGAPTGSYMLRCISPGGSVSTARFEVERFQLQDLQVTLETEQEIYFRNEIIQLEGHASWYWGAPLAEAKIQLQVPGGRQHQLVTDADGNFHLEFDTHEVEPGTSLRFTALAVEEGVMGDLTVYLAKTGFDLRLHAERPVQQVGKPMMVTLTASTPAGEPVSQELKVRLQRLTHLADGSIEPIAVETLTVTTDDQGKTQMQFLPEEGGDYVVHAEGIDRFGNLVERSTSFFLSGERDPQRLRLLAEEDSLKVGGALDFVLMNRVKPSLALLTFEGSGILDYRIVHLKEGENRFEELVPQDFFPEVTVAVGMMSEIHFHEVEKRFRVARHLNVQVIPRADQVRPGEEIEVELRVTDQNGKPVRAELSLAMVDEALFDLYPDRSGSIRAAFETGQRRASTLTSRSSNTFQYSGITEPIDEALIEEGRRQLAEQSWEDNRDKAAERLDQLGRRRFAGPGDAVPPVGGPSAPATPGAAAGNFDSDMLSALGYAEEMEEDSDSWNNEIGLGGGAGGKMGGRGGRGGKAGRDRAKATRPAGWADDAIDQEDTAHLDRMTGYWNPSILTGADGKAVVRFPAPTESTSWRLMARGTDVGTTIGQGTSHLITRADFFVEARWPSLLLEGDRGSVLVRVHNLTGLAGEADLKLALDYDGKQQLVTHKLGYSTDSMREVLLQLPDPVPAGLIGKATLEVTAAGGFAEPDGLSRIQELQASLTREVPVAPWGLPVMDAASGTLHDQAVLDLRLPKGGHYSAARWSLELGMGLDQMLLTEALGRPHPQRLGFHHGVRTPDRQSATASALLGALSVLRHLEESGATEDGPYLALTERAEGLLADLLNRQHADGGWSWSSSDRKSHVDVSAMAIIAMEAAKRAGLFVDADGLARGRTYLSQVLPSVNKRSHERRARLVYALSLSGNADFAFANSLHRDRDRLSTVACAFTALALVEMKSAPMAGEMAQAMLKRRGEESGHQGMHCTVLEGTALALWATVVAWPGAAEEIAAMEQELMARRPWYGADAHGLALTALAHARRGRIEETRDLTVLVQVGNGPEREIPLQGAMANVVLTEALEGASHDPQLRVRLRLRGKGQPHYALVLEGFDTDPKETRSRDLAVTLSEFHATPPVYDGREIQVGFGNVRNHRKEWRNTVTEVAYGGITPVRVDFYRNYKREDVEEELDFLMLEIPLPAGTRLLADSLSGNMRGWRVDQGVLKVDVGQHRGSGRVHFRLHGLQPGSYRTLPVVLRSVYRPDRFAVGKAGTLKVLERGQEVGDVYRATPDELYGLGMAAYAADDADFAWQQLSQLFAEFDAYLNPEPQKLAARAMLDLAIERHDANRIVQFFETLKEKDPALSVPFARLTRIAEAYRQLGESERAARIYRAVAQETFGKDLQLVAVLERQQDTHAAGEALYRFWQEYPDFSAVVETGVTLADRLLLAAPDAYRDRSLRDAKRNRVVLLYESILYLQRFLALYPEEPVAADAALNLINAYLDLEDYPNAARLADEFAGRFTEPRFLDAFLYTQAVAQWYQGEDAQAVALLTRIAESRYAVEGGGTRASDNRELALYILAQIHHARRDFQDAAAYYEKVSAVFADAREVLADFRRKALGLDEVTEVAPDEKAKLTLHYRNLQETELLVYPVDLMTLYLREKNLAGITQVNLAGIEPVIRSTVELPDDGSMRGQEHEVSLELPGPGAYLLICRSEAIHASGMILVSDFELEVETDSRNGGVRAQAVSRTDGSYLRDVDIRVIGSHDQGFQSGRTDPRGLYVTTGIRGAATVIARHGGRHYAFFRGAGAIPPPTLGVGGLQIESSERLDSESYFDNVRSLNRGQQQQRDSNLKNKQDQTYFGLELNSLQ